MSDHAKLHLIFRAGVSTAGKVKELSGRGVGLDVVAATVRKLGGDINVNTAAGRGVRFELDLPARRGLEAEPLAKAI